MSINSQAMVLVQTHKCFAFPVLKKEFECVLRFRKAFKTLELAEAGEGPRVTKGQSRSRTALT